MLGGGRLRLRQRRGAETAETRSEKDPNAARIFIDVSPSRAAFEDGAFFALVCRRNGWAEKPIVAAVSLPGASGVGLATASAAAAITAPAHRNAAAAIAAATNHRAATKAPPRTTTAPPR